MSSTRTFWFGQFVTAAQLNDAFTQLADAMANILLRHKLWGITTGMAPQQHGAGDLTLDFTAGAGFSSLAKPLVLAALTNIDLSVDYLGASTNPSSGKHRYVSVYAHAAVANSEPWASKAGGVGYWKNDIATSLKVVKGAEVDLASPMSKPGAPTSASDDVLLCDVIFTNGKTQILTADIDVSRKQMFLHTILTSHTLVGGTLDDQIAEFLSWYDEHVLGVGDRHADTALTAAASSGTPLALGYSGTTPVGGTVRSFLLELQAYINAIFVRQCAMQATAAHGTGVAGALYWHTVDYDDGDFLAWPLPPLYSGMDEASITVAGRYRFTVCVIWAANATGERVLVLQRDRTVGTTTLEEQRAADVRDARAAGPTYLNASAVFDCLAGDKLKAYLEQTSGNDLSYVAFGSIERVG